MQDLQKLFLLSLMSQEQVLGIWNKSKPQIKEINKWEVNVETAHLRQSEQNVLVRLWYIFIVFHPLLS